MESDAEGTILARLSSVMIRDTGGVLVAVMTDRSFEFFQRHAQEQLELGDVAGRGGRGTCLTTKKKKESTQYAHRRTAAPAAKQSSCTACALYTSFLKLSMTHPYPAWDTANNVRPCELVR